MDFRLAAGVMLLAFGGTGGPALGQPAAQAAAAAQPGGATAPRIRDALAMISDETADEAARLAAARALIAAPPEAAREAISEILGAPDPADRRAAILLRALGEAPAPGVRPLLLEGIRPGSGWPDGRRAAAIGALGIDQSRDTARALIERLAPAEAPVVRMAATAALIRITGRDDDELRRRGGQEAWQAWFKDRAMLPDTLWLADLAAGCAARADRLAGAKREVEAQYRRTMEQLYNASDAEQRVALLLAMLQEPLPAIRQLALDLIERALDGSQRISPEVGARIVELLADPAPDTRGRAALLIDRLRPDGAGASVAEALLREKDPEVAGRLLLALRNWPTPVARDVVLRWLEFDDPLIRQRAARVILAAHKAGIGVAAEDEQRVLAALRRPAPETLSRDGMELLVLLGDEGDREIIASLLTGPEEAARRLAAQIVATDPAQIDRLIEAARADPQIIPIAADAIAANGPTLAEFEAMEELIPADDPAREERLAAIAAGLSVADLIEVAARCAEAGGGATDTEIDTESGPDGDPEGGPEAGPEAEQPGAARAGLSAAFAERILARCIDLAAGASGSGPPEDPESLTRALLLLAELRLGLNRPDMALEALEPLDPSWAAEAPGAAEARTLALLLLGRLDDPRLAAPLNGAGADEAEAPGGDAEEEGARTTGAPTVLIPAASPDIWLDALERSIHQKLPHAAQIQQAIARFEPILTPPQRVRLAACAAALQVATAEEPATEGDGAPPGGG